jgi:hypothetical protein
MMTLELLKLLKLLEQAWDSLSEFIVDPDISFGPAHAGATERRAATLLALQQAIQKSKEQK